MTPSHSRLLAFVSALLGLSACSPVDPQRSTEPVGQRGQRTVLPVSQILTPAGRQVVLPGMRPQALALSPDGRVLVTSGKTSELVVLDPDSAAELQRLPLPADAKADPPSAPSPHEQAPDKEAQLSFTGLVFSPDGSRLYLSNVAGSVKVFAVAGDRMLQGAGSIALPQTGLSRRQADIPTGLAFSPDGSRLYIALNLSNRLLEVDPESGVHLRTFEVGVAPYDVIVRGRKGYVSNWGGPRPDVGSVVGPAGKGTLVRVDPVRHIASEGSVSVVDLEAGRVVMEALVELHPCSLAMSPDGSRLYVANAASDSISVLDTRTDTVTRTISVRWQPRDYFGATPNALAMAPDGKTLYAAHGTQNAIAAVGLDLPEPKLRGLIPVGWFPGAVLHDARRGQLYVANIKGIGSGRRTAPDEEAKHNSHEHRGSLSLVPVPDAAELVRHTRQVLANCRREIVEAAQLPPRPGVAPRPVPERAGEPSVFEHVVYVIKENRTYDQVLGDIPEGNGDPKLCIFGAAITPNQHRLVREFVLLDNAYCSGVLSADGHQWSTAGITTDYLERSFAGWPRSYPDGMDDDDVDALSYPSTGFLWDNALEHGKTVRVYGEFAIADIGWKDPGRKPPPTFTDYYRDFIDGKGETRVASRPAIESIRHHMELDTVGWTMDVPDVVRAARFIDELREFERTGGFPNLVIICLPNDHTSGTKAGMPTPAAHVADNDLAFGRIVEAVSRSRFWPKTCILAIEDDPQDGWDHVSAYRTTAYVASPYTRRGAVIGTQYNQPGLLRTIELILGLPPMNQMDAAATPFTDCFTDEPDFRPFTALPANVPLDQLNPEPAAIEDPLLREHAVVSASLPLDQIDKCPEGVLNRILWHAQKGPAVAYPEWAELEEDDD
jgi:YVTN family beta-propeller protein